MLVPRKKIRQILEEDHDSPSGEYFGVGLVSKILDRIRKLLLVHLQAGYRRLD